MFQSEPCLVSGSVVMGLRYGLRSLRSEVLAFEALDDFPVLAILSRRISSITTLCCFGCETRRLGETNAAPDLNPSSCKLVKSRVYFHASLLSVDGALLRRSYALSERVDRVVGCDVCGPCIRPGNAGGPPDALSRHPRRQDRIRLRRRLVAGFEFGWPSAAHHHAPRARAVPEIFSRRQMDRLHRPIRRQLQRVRHARRRRTAQATHLLPGGRAAAQRPHGHSRRSRELVSRQQAHRLLVATRCLERMDQAALQRQHRRRVARTSAYRSGRSDFVLTRRDQDRLQHHLPQFPHLEALHRRPGPVHHHL